MTTSPTPGEADRDLTDVFERPFTDPDDPRLQCARVLTRAEAEAVLEHRGNLIEVLAQPHPSQQAGTEGARIQILEAAIQEARRQLNDMQGDCVFYNLGVALEESAALNTSEARG